MSKTVRVDINGTVASVVLDRADTRNAFQAQMIQEITETFASLATRTDIRAIILRGEGKSFSAGADLGYMKSMAAFTLKENEADADKLFQMFWTIRSTPQPVIGRLHGHVMGGALGLASVCDVAAAVEGTKFCFSEVKLGIAPAVISPFVLEKMQASHARRFMLTAEVFEARDALASSLVHFVGDEAAVDQFVDSVVKSVVANGPEAVRATKNLIREVSETPDWSRRRELTTKVIAERRVSSEGQEGLKSFFEKREPTWKK